MLSKNFFLIPNQGEIVAWDFVSYRQYILEKNNLDRIFAHRKDSQTPINGDDKDLVEAGFIISENPKENWGWDPLSKIFHLGTNHPEAIECRDSNNNMEATQSYLDFCKSIHESEPKIELIKGGHLISLPPPDLAPIKSANMWLTLKRRKTCRDFENTPIPVTTISDLLYITFGKISTEDFDAPLGIQRFGYRRSSPSAGGLQACEAYLWASNVDGLPQGIYHYISTKHSLELVCDSLPKASLSSHLCNQHWADDLPFAIFITVNFSKLWWKYPHSRAYRPALIDVGHLSQTLNLAITAYNLLPWMTGYFIDTEINKILLTDGNSEHVVFMVGAGKGSGSPYTRELVKLCESKK